jgi:imidazolonepropionase-like amidohydrolase
MQGLLSVTSEAARALNMDEIVGTLEPGKEADVIVVNGNPAEDIGALWNVDEVFLAGQRIDRGSPESIDAFRQQRPSDSSI